MSKSNKKSSKVQSNDLSQLGSMVYSTGSAASPSPTEPEVESVPGPKNQELEAHLEKKGRGGKTAIIIKGFRGSESELKKLGKALKNHCATGGSAKDGEIIIQGNQRDKAMDFLRKQGFKVKRVGG